MFLWRFPCPLIHGTSLWPAQGTEAATGRNYWSGDPWEPIRSWGHTFFRVLMTQASPKAYSLLCIPLTFLQMWKTKRDCGWKEGRDLGVSIYITPEEEVEHTGKCVGACSYGEHGHDQEVCTQQEAVLCQLPFLKLSCAYESPGIMVKCRLWLSRSGVGPEMLPFQQTLR